MVKKTATKISRVAVIGFGNQGLAHAVLLRRSRRTVVVGLTSKSTSRRRAKVHKFRVTTPALAVRDCDTVALLVPDQVASSLLADLGGALAPGTLVVVAAGFPLHFPTKPLPDHVDVVLVAPHGPGSDLTAGRQVSAFVGVQQDVTGRALKRARAYAGAIGLKPLFETTPRLEALGDVFGEQTLLCGGLLGLVSSVAATMIRRGIPAENAYFETVAQTEQLARLLRERGVDGFWNAISDCAAAGSAQVAPRLFDAHFRDTLDDIWTAVESGEFARRFQKRGRPSSLPSQFRMLRKLERAGKPPPKKRAAPKNRP